MSRSSRCFVPGSVVWLAALIIALNLRSSPHAQAVPPPDLPNLIGMQVDEAVSTLNALKVAVTTAPPAVPEGVDRSVVLVQDVIDTSVHIDPGPTNAVRLLLGAAVPKVAALSAGAATAAITARGLVADRIPTGAPDTAIVQGQDPAAGALVPLGAPVTLTVVSLVAVPDIRGFSVNNAQDATARDGLQLTIAAIPAGSTAGDVLGQRPSPGTQVPVGSIVYAQVAVIPPPPTLVQVPSIVGFDPTQVGHVLKTSGLTLAATMVGSGPAFTAVQQDPPPGAMVLPGSTVAVRFEATPAPALITVPSVLGLDPDRAAQVISGHGLAMSATKVGSGSAFTAVQQDPHPGALVAAASAIAVRFAAQPPPTHHQQFPLATVGGLAGLTLIIAAACLLIVRQVRATRQRRWVSEHVTVHADVPPAEIRLDDTDQAGGHAVLLEPHPDPGIQALQETRR